MNRGKPPQTLTRAAGDAEHGFDVGDEVRFAADGGLVAEGAGGLEAALDGLEAELVGELVLVDLWEAEAASNVEKVGASLGEPFG